MSEDTLEENGAKLEEFIVDEIPSREIPDGFLPILA